MIDSLKSELNRSESQRFSRAFPAAQEQDRNTSRAGIRMLPSDPRHCDASPGGAEVCVCPGVVRVAMRRVCSVVDSGVVESRASCAVGGMPDEAPA